MLNTRIHTDTQAQLVVSDPRDAIIFRLDTCAQPDKKQKQKIPSNKIKKKQILTATESTDYPSAKISNDRRI